MICVSGDFNIFDGPSSAGGVRVRPQQDVGAEPGHGDGPAPHAALLLAGHAQLEPPHASRSQELQQRVGLRPAHRRSQIPPANMARP